MMLWRYLHRTRDIAHPDSTDTSQRHGGKENRYIGNVVYGGLDGIVTTFAVVSGVMGAELSMGIVLILGFANLLADGFSMATGAYLSAKSEREYYEREWQRELWQIQHQPEVERQALYEGYLKQGFAKAEASQMVDAHSRNPHAWAKVMMIEELGILTDDRNPLFSALVTFGAFALAGAMPLLVYLLGVFVPISSRAAFGASLALSGLALFMLGAAKVLVTGRNALRSGLEMLIVGSMAAFVAYVVGALLKGLG